MAVPKKRTSSSKSKMRRSHQALGKNPYSEDKTTGNLHRSHHIDLESGTYKGKKIITTKENV